MPWSAPVFPQPPHSWQGVREVVLPFQPDPDAVAAVLLRVSDTDFVAFNQKCTHLGCVVYYEAEEHRWHCPCHEGNFEAETGAVISGPPLRPLGRIDVEVRADGKIWALGRSEAT